MIDQATSPRKFRKRRNKGNGISNSCKISYYKDTLPIMILIPKDNNSVLKHTFNKRPVFKTSPSLKLDGRSEGEEDF